MAKRKPNARERILETAGALFFQRGYSEVGINEIIEKAGTAKASFYQHYPSKQSLCEAWLQSLHEQSEHFRVELLQSDESPVTKVTRYFDHLESFMVTSHFRGCPFSNTNAVSDDSCGGIIDRVKSHKESIRTFFVAIAGQQIAVPERAAAIGDRLFVLFSGASAEAQNLKAIWPVQAGKDAAIEMLQS
ncbi:MAG: TetR/AcrR family transcriptional regulator [Verrucomicrobiales bacterium]|jgi:AcrR family transcriptional regulator|nr:TetR/AcrR family transcriptional regulator [Verrucomicrobiales bacterium]MBP9222850.1 TetR/AcrR family transcriptional regulator [Verrucomicrobiales bacterium]HQZ28335.1 TetR/AcrR family transcriptional regulator [Verrucomicrobiales bacterium]